VYVSNVFNYAYDSRGLKTNEVGAGIYTNSFTYNGAGDLLSLKDGKSQTTSWKFDQFGRVTNKVDASGITNFLYKYNANGWLTNRWTPAKTNAYYAYDAVGNLTNVDYAVSPDLTLQYDALNRLTNLIDAAGATGFSYDSVGQLLSEDGPWNADTVSYAYSSRLRTSLTLLAPDASAWTQSYGYDGSDRLTNIVSTGGAFSYQYSSGVGSPASASSLIKKLSLPNTSYITNTFDSVARQLT